MFSLRQAVFFLEAYRSFKYTRLQHLHDLNHTSTPPEILLLFLSGKFVASLTGKPLEVRPFDCAHAKKVNLSTKTVAKMTEAKNLERESRVITFRTQSNNSVRNHLFQVNGESVDPELTSPKFMDSNYSTWNKNSFSLAMLFRSNPDIFSETGVASKLGNRFLEIDAPEDACDDILGWEQHCIDRFRVTCSEVQREIDSQEETVVKRKFQILNLMPEKLKKNLQ